MKIISLYVFMLCNILTLNASELKSTIKLAKKQNLLLSEFELSDAVFWYFCANSKWRVTEESGAIVAYARKSNSFLSNNKLDDLEQIHVTVRMSPYSKRNSLVKDASFFRYEKNISDYSITVSTKQSGTYSSVVICKVNNLFIRVIEHSNSVERKYTGRIIENVISEINNVLLAYQKTKQFFCYDLLLKNSVSEKSSFNLSEKYEGIYKVSGYVNPLQKGKSLIKIINVKTKEPISESKAKMRTVEYVGWSPDKNKKFYFESEISVDSLQKKLNAKFQLEFYPTKGKILLEKEQEVTTWTR